VTGTSSTLIVLLGVLSTGCHGPRTAPEPIAAVPACPGPALDVAGWAAIADSAGVTYRLPGGFIERPDSTLPYRRWTASDGSSGDLAVGFIHSREHWITLRRAPSPGMHEMSECVDSVAGRQLLVQAWRTEGGIFRDRRRFDRYDVFALVPITPGLTVYLTGGGSDRRFQALLLAMARTLRVGEP
jgi:hypothetical protein